MSSKVLATTFVAVAISGGGCFLGTGGGGGGTGPTGDNKTGVSLTVDFAFDQQGDDSGGAKQAKDIPLTWEGALVGGEGGGGDAFTKDSSTYAVPTDPWKASTIVTQLNPGQWNLQVTFNGATYACASAVTLVAGDLKNVTFYFDKDSGVFNGCSP